MTAIPTIEPTVEAHVEGYRNVVDAVSRERLYLVSVEGFPADQTREFVANILGGDGVQYLALDEGEVVGWCDIVRYPSEGFRHVGKLGMGILAEYRGQGLGRRLLETTVAAAPGIGISRVELEVFASNAGAINLYRRFGFADEGRKRKVRILDGHVDDILCMAIFLEDPVPELAERRKQSAE